MNRSEVFVLCFGESGRRVGNHLNLYKRNESLSPLAVENSGAISLLLRPLGQGRIIMVSKLDDPLLTVTLTLLLQSSKLRRITITGYFIHPFHPETNLPANIVANLNLRKSYEVLDRVRVVNLPDYEPGSARPKWPLRWLDDEMDDSEKQIVWEILQNEQSESKRSKKRR